MIVFLCCDMGETNALIPVMTELDGKNIPFNIIAMGAAIPRIQSEISLKNRLIEVKEPVNTAQDRTKPLERVADVIQNLQPIVVISGPASKPQEQLLQQLKAKKKIVYLDNFNYAIEHPYFATVLGVVKEAHRVICVSDIVKKQILSIENGTLRERDIKPLGRPSLESWVQQVKDINKTETLKKIPLNATKPIVTLIGGYGPRYEEGVNAAYENAAKALSEKGYQVHRQYHPNVVKEQPLTTVEAVGIADYIVCYDSTVGFEALFAGKKTIYFQPEGVAPYDNIAIEKRLATRVKNEEELLQALTPSDTELPDIYATLAVERKSTAAVTNYILKKIQKAIQKGWRLEDHYS